MAEYGCPTILPVLVNFLFLAFIHRLTFFLSFFVFFFLFILLVTLSHAYNDRLVDFEIKVESFDINPFPLSIRQAQIVYDLYYTKQRYVLYYDMAIQSTYEHQQHMCAQFSLG